MARQLLDPTEYRSAGGATLLKTNDQSILATGKNPSNDTYTVFCKLNLGQLSGLRLEVLPDVSLAAQGPGRASNGNFVLTEVKVVAAPTTKPAQPADSSWLNH